jgi:hypothetical protein
MSADGYGVGIGWRPEIAGFVADLPDLRFTEVIASRCPGAGRPRPPSPHSGSAARWSYPMG